MPKKTPRPIQTEDDKPVRFSLELEGEEKDLFLAVQDATHVKSNAEVARMGLIPGLKAVLEKLKPANSPKAA